MKGVMFFGETRGRCPCFLLCRNKQKSTGNEML